MSARKFLYRAANYKARQLDFPSCYRVSGTETLELEI